MEAQKYVVPNRHIGIWSEGTRTDRDYEGPIGACSALEGCPGFCAEAPGIFVPTTLTTDMCRRPQAHQKQLLNEIRVAVRT